MKFAFVTLVFVSLTSVACNTQGIAIPKETLRYTRQLPAVDKVELQKVSGIERIEKVEATKVLTDKEALAVATLWREQTYGGTGAACHEPAYTIKFFSKEKLIVYASVCYGCQNIDFIDPAAKNLVGFNAHGKKGQQLLRVFQNAFPQPNTEQKKN
ncbi:MAG: hypothetical protein JNJ50_02070 [Acidobacteria bacterium]|nr:hypothetical protein [Acidobacteriota bacterium]